MWGAIIGGVVSLASSLYGNYKASKANKEANEELDKAYKQQQGHLDQLNANNNALYAKNYYSDYLNRSDSQAAINKVRDVAREYVQNARGRAAVMGSTAEAAQVAEGQANNMVGNVISDVAQRSAQYRDNVEQNYFGQQNNIIGAKANLAAAHGNQLAAQYRAQAQNISQATTNTGNSISNLISNLYSSN